MEGESLIPLEKFPKANDYHAKAKFIVESGYTFFSMSRDPVSRWISGLNEFMCRYKAPTEWVIKQVKNKKYVFDEHTAPQHLFLRLCSDYNGTIKLLKLDNHLNDKVNNFLRTFKGRDHKDLDIGHLRDSKYFVPNCTMLAKKVFHTYIEPDMDTFNKFYAPDYELYNSAE